MIGIYLPERQFHNLMNILSIAKQDAEKRVKEGLKDHDMNKTIGYGKVIDDIASVRESLNSAWEHRRNEQ